jgi:hypothetical protein
MCPAADDELQVYERGAAGRLTYWQVVSALRREGGPRSFYRGIGLELAKVGCCPSAHMPAVVAAVAAWVYDAQRACLA